MSTTENQIRALATQAGVYFEHGMDIEVAACKDRAAALVAGTASNALRHDYRMAWASGFDNGRRIVHHIGNCEPFPASAREHNPSPKLRRALADADVFDGVNRRAA